MDRQELSGNLSDASTILVARCMSNSLAVSRISSEKQRQRRKTAFKIEDHVQEVVSIRSILSARSRLDSSEASLIMPTATSRNDTWKPSRRGHNLRKLGKLFECSFGSLAIAARRAHDLSSKVTSPLKRKPSSLPIASLRRTRGTMQAVFRAYEHGLQHLVKLPTAPDSVLHMHAIRGLIQSVPNHVLPSSLCVSAPLLAITATVSSFAV